MVAVGGLVLTLFPPTAPIGAATLISSSIVGAPGAAYGTGNSLSDQRNILTINPKYDYSLFNELHVQYVPFYIGLFSENMPKFKIIPCKV